MSELAGTRILARLNLRRDRVLAPLCVYGVVAMVLGTGWSYQSQYPTTAARVAFARTIEGNAALAVFFGPARALDTIGGLVTWRIGAIGALVVALISLLIVGRHTRADEELGRTELVLAAPTGRQAPLSAALAVVAALDVAIALLVAGGLIALGLPAAGSLALGASLGAAGLVFGGVGAIAAQVTEAARTAHAIAGTALGLSYALRAAGDMGAGALTWLSPLGWGEHLRPYAGERWWPLALALATAAALVAIAFRLLARRDIGAGLLAQRPGPPAASDTLTRPLGFALRLQRASLAGWSAGLLLLGLVLGAVAKNIGDVLNTNGTARELLTQTGGGDPVDSYFASVILLLALTATGFTIQSALRPRGEETGGRAEPVLATAIGRWRWAGSHVAIAATGSIVAVVAAGLGLGLSYALAIGDWAWLPRLVGASLAAVPAVLVLAGVAVALFGVAPRALPAAWGALAACVVLWFAGPLANLPAWVLDLSPYHHITALPGGELRAGPLLALTAIAAGLTAGGLIAFRRRDLS